MKIAVLLSGMPTFLDQSKLYTRNLFKGHEVDYFCHAWFDKNKKEEDKSWHNMEIKIDLNTEEKILDLYKPKKYLLEVQRQFEIPRNYSFNTGWPQPFFIVYSHFYSLKTANLLRLMYEKENNVKYDIVVKMRYDIVIANKIEWEKYDLNKLYLHNNCNCWYDLYDDASFNDMFAFSKPENMNIYCDTFYNIDKFYMENFLRFSCENFLSYQLLSNNIDVVPLNFSRSFMLRGDFVYDLTVGKVYDMKFLEKIVNSYD